MTPQQSLSGRRTVGRIARPLAGALALGAICLAAAPEARAQAASPAASPAAPPAVTAPQAAPLPLPQVTFEEIMGIDARRGRWNPTALGVGAIGGVIGYNVLAPMLFPVANAAGGPLAGTIVADSVVSASRIYAVSSAVAGAFLGQWIYDRINDR
jgi:hypothetical protein